MHLLLFLFDLIIQLLNIILFLLNLFARGLHLVLHEIEFAFQRLDLLLRFRAYILRLVERRLQVHEIGRLILKGYIQVRPIIIEFLNFLLKIHDLKFLCRQLRIHIKNGLFLLFRIFRHLVFQIRHFSFIALLEVRHLLL